MTGGSQYLVKSYRKQCHLPSVRFPFFILRTPQYSNHTRDVSLTGIGGLIQAMKLSGRTHRVFE